MESITPRERPTSPTTSWEEYTCSNLQRSFKKISKQLHLQLGQGTTYAALLVHVMSWFLRRFIIWVDEKDFELNLGLATRYPLMVSAVTGHTIDVDMNYLCEKMLRTTTDPWPHVIDHGTYFSMLRGMLEAEGIVSGGGRQNPRPIHCESFAMKREGRAMGIEGRRKFRYPSIPPIGPRGRG